MAQRYSKKRETILNLLKRSKRALSAAEISDRLPEVNLVTVYRNLDRFVEEKLVKKLQLKDGEARYEYQHEPHHHAICTECNKVIHFTAPDEKIKQLLGIENFEVDELEVTVRGICKHEK